MPIDVVILAGGKGKRMHSRTPKVLHPLAGTPMLQRVVSSAERLSPHRIHVIYNEAVPQVRDELSHLDVNWVVQKTAKGTAHALAQSLPHIPDEHHVISLNGDAPLLKPETLQRLLDNSPENGLGIVITHLDKPTGYGRILRDEVGNVIDIVEEKCATDAQKIIKDVYPGICTAKAIHLKKWMPQITDDNAQHEYLLTDILNVAKRNGHQIGGTRIENEIEICGVNNLLELITLEKYFYLQRTHSLMLQGLTIRDPERFTQRGVLKFGKDIVIDVNVLIEGFVSIGNNAQIGANVILADTEIGDNVIIDPYCEIRNQCIPEGTHVTKDFTNTTA